MPRFISPMAAMVLILATPLMSAQAEQRKPNVLFIVCDDLNTNVSTSGYKHIKTPTFDELAAAGMTFSRAYCQYPVCGPSRASFLSGLYPESTGMLSGTEGHRVNQKDIRKTRPGTPSMPERFRSSGYWTARVGKVFHNAKTNPDDVWDENPDRFENDPLPVLTAAQEKFEAEHGPARGKNRARFRESIRDIPQTHIQPRPGYGPSGLTDEQHKDGKNAIQIAEWLDNKAQGDKPFFIACGIQKPHAPFLAPNKYFDMYPQSGLVFDTPPKDFWEQAPRMAISHRYRGFGFELGVENDALRRAYMQSYHACITFIDTQIGKVLETVKRNGLWDDTIIIFTSDHGYHLGEHYLWGKVTLFEIGARVPLIIRVPEKYKRNATKPGSKSDGLVELVDLFPTLAELCGVEPPAELQGRSLVPMLRDPSVPGKAFAYTVVTRARTKLGRAIRTQRWRYTRWPEGEELYDLQADPREWKNLVESASHAQILEKLRGQLDQVQTRAAEKEPQSISQ